MHEEGDIHGSVGVEDALGGGKKVRGVIDPEVGLGEEVKCSEVAWGNIQNFK
jgi:hypothetical protein